MEFVQKLVILPQGSPGFVLGHGRRQSVSNLLQKTRRRLEIEMEAGASGVWRKAGGISGRDLVFQVEWPDFWRLFSKFFTDSTRYGNKITKSGRSGLSGRVRKISTAKTDNVFRYKIKILKLKYDQIQTVYFPYNNWQWTPRVAALSKICPLNEGQKLKND